MKAGGAYLPLDPDSPGKRKQFMLTDSDTSGCWSEKVAYRNRWPSLTVEVIPIDNGSGSAESDVNPKVDSQWRQITSLIVIYTSGTTGEPKGSMIDHHSVHLTWSVGLHNQVYQKYDSQLRVCLLAPVIFDASVQQIFASLLLGHSLFVVPDEIRTDGRKLLAFYSDHGIEISDGTPTHLRILLEAQKDLRIDIPVKHFIIGGESHVSGTGPGFSRAPSRGTASLVTNVYGPTECCVDTTAFTFQADDSLQRLKSMPIGAPLCNTQVYILDSALMPVPDRCAGRDMYRRSRELSRGYLNRPELNERKIY